MKTSPSSGRGYWTVLILLKRPRTLVTARSMIRISYNISRAPLKEENEWVISSLLCKGTRYSRTWYVHTIAGSPVPLDNYILLHTELNTSYAAENTICLTAERNPHQCLQPTPDRHGDGIKPCAWQKKLKSNRERRNSAPHETVSSLFYENWMYAGIANTVWLTISQC